MRPLWHLLGLGAGTATAEVVDQEAVGKTLKKQASSRKMGALQMLWAQKASDLLESG